MSKKKSIYQQSVNRIPKNRRCRVLIKSWLLFMERWSPRPRSWTAAVFEAAAALGCALYRCTLWEEKIFLGVSCAAELSCVVRVRATVSDRRGKSVARVCVYTESAGNGMMANRWGQKLLVIPEKEG